MLTFIAESKRQIALDARNSIKQVEQWERQTCAMFDMIQQHIVHNLQDDRRHRHESIEKSTVNGVKKASEPPATVRKSTVTKSSVAAKKLSAKIVKKTATTAKKPIVAKTSVKKAAPAPIVPAKKRSTVSIKRNVEKPPRKSADFAAERSHLDGLPDLSSECSRQLSPENTPTRSEHSACPSMPGMLNLCSLKAFN